MGLALFGGGDMTLLSGTQTSLADGLWRLLLAVAYLTVQLSALGALGLFISTLTEQPIGATIAVVLINVLMFILDSISQLAWLHPWLLTHWWTAIGDLLRDPIATDGIERGLITAVGLRRHVLAGRVGAVLQQGHHQLMLGRWTHRRVGARDD